MDLVQAILELANSREDPAALPIEQRTDLAERLLAGGKLTLGESQYLGALLLAEAHRRRPDPRRAARHREIAMAARVLMITEGKTYIAVELAAKRFKVSESTVRNALRKQKAEASESLEAMLCQFAAAWAAGHRSKTANDQFAL